MADAGDRATAPPNHRKPHGSGQPRPHPPHGSQHAPRNYKTLSDKDLGAKETIRRYNGHIPGHPKYDVKLPLSDPRNQYIRYRVVPPADLNVPTFTIDRNTLFCPKIEVAVFKLNDNVSKAFLHQLVSKIAPPVDLEVFYHPVTKKHMGMAMIVFNSFNEARKFVLEYDGKSIMGGQVSCCHDPYFALLSQRFEDATGEEMRIPVHLKTLEETILNTRRSQLASKHRALMQANQSTFPPEPTVGQSDDVMDVDSPAVSVEPATPRNMEKALEPLTPSLDLPAPRTLTARPRTPLLDPPPPPTPSLDGPSLVGHPLPNAFAPHVPPPPVPMFHSGQCYEDARGRFAYSEVDRRYEDVYPSGSFSWMDGTAMNNYFVGDACWAPYASYYSEDPRTSLANPPDPPPYSYNPNPRSMLTEPPPRHSYAGFRHNRADHPRFRRGYAGFERDSMDERRRRGYSPERESRSRPRFRRRRDDFGYEPEYRDHTRFQQESRADDNGRGRDCFYTTDSSPKRGHGESQPHEVTTNRKRFSKCEVYPESGCIVTRYRYDGKPRQTSNESSRKDVNNNQSHNSEYGDPNCQAMEGKPMEPPQKKSRWDVKSTADFNAPHLQPGPSNLPPPMPPLTPGFCPLAYPPPPPYSVLPPGGSTQFPPNYPHLPVTQPLPGASSAPISEEKAAPHTPRTPAETSRNKKDGRARQSKKKKKKRRRHSSDSSSDSSSSSSLNVGEYLRVEKKEMSTKYISREREGLEKTIVEEIKTVTKKKKYRLTESKRNDAKTAGLQLVSSDESVEQHEGDDVDGEREKRTVAPGGEREKKEVHRWSSSSTDSEGDRIQKKEKKNEKLTASTSLADSTTQAPAAMVLPPPPPPSMFMSPPRAANHSLPPPGPVPPSLLPPPHMGLPLPPPGTLPLMPTHLPPPFPLPPMNPSLVGGPPFNPLLPPPNFSIGQPPPPAFPKRAFPKVSLRFVEDSAPPPSKSSTAPLSKSSAPPQPTLADRVASIFGGEPHLASPSKAQPEPSTSAKHHRSNDAASDDVDDMDVDVGSSMSPPDASPSPCLSENRLSRSSIRKKRRRKHRGASDKKMSRFMRNVKAVREATEKVIGEEIVDVITKDFYKRIEGVSFEILEEVLAEIRHELEEQKRNEAQQALRAQAEIVTTEKPSDVSQLCSPLGAVSASLNTTPEKLGSFPFTINMPKLPSFKRKVRPPSPDSESSRSPVARKRDAESESDDSDAAQKSSSCSRRSDSSEEIVLRKKQGRHYRSPSVSGSESSSEISSSEAEANRSKSSASGATLVREDALSVSSTAASTASSIASSESSPASEAEDHDDRDASTVTDEPRIPTPEPPKKEEVEIPLWTKIISSSSMDWCESLPGSSYHVNLTEHCYFKLPPEGEEQVRKTGDVVKVEEEKPLAPKQVIKPPTPLKKGRLSKQDRELLGLFPTAEVRAPPPRPKIVYPPWSHEDNIKHIGQWDCCFDPEDQDYLKQAWMQLQPSGENATLPPWGKALRFNFWSWADKPNLLEKPVKKGRLDQYFADSELDGILPIQDGCARTRGYFKMSMKEKRRLIRRPEDEQRDKTVISERDEAAVRHNLVLTKESRSMHRRLLTTMGDTNTDFFKVNQLKYRKKMIKFARSRIHGWGLYAMEPIAPDDMIVEYVGQKRERFCLTLEEFLKVRNTVADVREKAYERRGIGSSYLFRIDDTTVIDATRMGNFARFINHSCQPNCYAKVVTVDGDKRIVIYSKTLINKGDEITYDYKFPIEEDKVDCLCGAPNCRGTLN